MSNVIKENITRDKPTGHLDTQKEGGFPARSTLTVPHHAPTSHRTREISKDCTSTKDVAEDIPRALVEVAGPCRHWHTVEATMFVI